MATSKKTQIDDLAAEVEGMLKKERKGKPATQKTKASHVIVKALAGTGKTTTIIGALHFANGTKQAIKPSPQQKAIWEAIASEKAATVCLCAFNKSIATELQKRVPQGVQASTLHSLGSRILRADMRFKGARVDDWKPHKTVTSLEKILGIDFKEFGKNYVPWSVVVDMVSLCKMNLIDPRQSAELFRDAIDPIATHHELNLSSGRYNVPDLIQRCLLDALNLDQSSGSRSWMSEIDFDDMIWIPVIEELPFTKFDLLMVDECLPGWMPILLADGTSKTIKEIVENKLKVKVLAFNTATGKQEKCSVTKWSRTLNQKPLVKIKVKWNRRIGTNRPSNFVICTEDHKVWCDGQWIPAGEVCLGMTMQIETAAQKTQSGKISGIGRKTLSKTMTIKNRTLDRTNQKRGSITVRGGNGKGLTLAESTLLQALGNGWIGHHIIKTEKRKGLPNHYKIDIADVEKKIAVEVDGTSHSTKIRQEQDRRKEEFLRSIGWKVIRVPNRRAIQKTSEVVREILSSDCIIGGTVVSVQSTEIPDNFVYDISVKGCHNFYANGILVHNCQDLNLCQHALAERSGKRLVFVGDSRQALYGFSGADSESMDRLERNLRNSSRGVIVLPLTETRRCGHAIVEDAKEIVPQFTAHKDNPEGLVREIFDTQLMNEVQSSDMVICRVNAPLVSTCFRLLKTGRKAFIQGRDIGKGLVKLIEKFKAQTIVELTAKLDQWYRSERDKLEAKKYPSESALIALDDKFSCLTHFMDSCETPADMIQMIGRIFQDGGYGVLLSSIHRAKGLESNRVFILKPELIPHPMCRLDWQIEQEYNAKYVGITRAIHELVWVKTTRNDDE